MPFTHETTAGAAIPEQAGWLHGLWSTLSYSDTYKVEPLAAHPVWLEPKAYAQGEEP